MEEIFHRTANRERFVHHLAFTIHLNLTRILEPTIAESAKLLFECTRILTLPLKRKNTLLIVGIEGVFVEIIIGRIEDAETIGIGAALYLAIGYRRVYDAYKPHTINLPPLQAVVQATGIAILEDNGFAGSGATTADQYRSTSYRAQGRQHEYEKNEFTHG